MFSHQTSTSVLWLFCGNHKKIHIYPTKTNQDIKSMENLSDGPMVPSISEFHHPSSFLYEAEKDKLSKPPILFNQTIE